MGRKLLIKIAFLFVAGVGCCLPLGAQEIVRWVDEEGVTHFGNPHLAPAAAAVETVEVQEANAMVVPDSVPARVRNRPTVTVLPRTVRENERGFRGYGGRTRRNNRSRY